MMLNNKNDNLNYCDTSTYLVHQQRQQIIKRLYNIMAVNKLKHKRIENKNRLKFESPASMSIIVPNSRHRGKTISPIVNKAGPKREKVASTLQSQNRAYTSFNRNPLMSNTRTKDDYYRNRTINTHESIDSVRNIEGATSRTELRGDSLELPDSIKKMLNTIGN